MPLPNRSYAPRVSPGEGDDLRARALDVLLSDDLAHVVALVAWKDGELVHVADSRGHATLAAAGAKAVLEGVDPVADTDPSSDEGWPYAGERLHSLFRERRAPDLAVVHTGGHHWPERGGHRGEHGSLSGRQSRAPFVLSGAGVTARGLVDGTARTVDVGATLTALAGGDLSGMEGSVCELAAAQGQYVVGLLWDGAPSALVLAGAADGSLPNVARLLARGCALTGGAVAEFPSVTLVNHTCALTGVGPGTHGIVNNSFYDRDLGQQVVANSSATWHSAMQWLRPGVRTVFERLPEGVVSACVDDPVDRGATWSTFAQLRDAGGASGGIFDLLPAPADDPLVTQEFVDQGDFAWGSTIDAAGLVQVLDLWREGEPPRLMWWNSTLTDGAHHAGGPGSPIGDAGLRDTDARLGVWLDLLEERGLADRVTVLLTADHGMEAADPSVTGDWGAALAAAGVPFRDESEGFLYLGTS